MNKVTSFKFLDFMDRVYELGNLHPCKKAHTMPLQHGQFSKFQKGQMTHLLVYKDGVVFVRLVPNDGVQFLFDCYAT